MNDNLVLGTLLTGLSRRFSWRGRRKNHGTKPRCWEWRKNKCKDKTYATQRNVMHLLAGPASQATRKHSSLLFGRQAFSGRKARREKGWGIYLAPSFLLFPPGPEPSELPLTFRLHYSAPRWPLMKPDASGWLFIPDWKQGSTSADQKGGALPKKGKEKVIQGSWNTQSVVQNNILYSDFQRDGHTGQPTELERKINTVFSKRSSGHLSKTQGCPGSSVSCQRTWETQHHLVRKSTALAAMLFSKAYKNVLRSPQIYCFQNTTLINWH